MILPRELFPRLDVINGPFFDAAAQGVLRLQQCDDCDRWIFYPRVICPYCQGSRLTWRRASGRGSLYSFTVVYRPHHPVFDAEAPIVFAAVETLEGPVMLTELISSCRDNAFVGMPLTVRFKTMGGGLYLPIWGPEG